ncbi:MAG: hypothetical protein A3A33_01070 [Candidatus Yanofskybacteria bacterium RIFCSPLOWO2_01_FULL_49_25]|uniref:Uncharacterized protein n=1 Tax=Candidatus Yanofskybacteria bacterium RIFCSPLOWO2_01_FULL_49_25 TaxID=1802701 RepID=A0A1F8GT74_9BACT|nr:MAG: hypothetical protein A3A33_01070 [Candidatus Yanofskybacteria bacterium RIFCSPLOWO2_01_FULL_49_25]
MRGSVGKIGKKENIRLPCMPAKCLILSRMFLILFSRTLLNVHTKVPACTSAPQPSGLPPRSCNFIGTITFHCLQFVRVAGQPNVLNGVFPSSFGTANADATHVTIQSLNTKIHESIFMLIGLVLMSLKRHINLIGRSYCTVKNAIIQRSYE